MYAQFQAMCRTKNLDLKKAGASQKDKLIRAEQERFALPFFLFLPLYALIVCADLRK